MKSKRVVLLFLLFFQTFNLFAQEIEWQNTIGGSDSDGLNSIIQTMDGGYLLGGSSWSDLSGDKTENSNGGLDYWIVKTDSLGIIEWQNTIGGNDYDNLVVVIQIDNEGYLIAGTSDSDISGDKTENSIGSSSQHDFWVVKTDLFGSIEWQNTIGGLGSDVLYSAIRTVDGGYLLGGQSDSDISGDKTENSLGGSDFWIVKIDSAGSIQ